MRRKTGVRVIWIVSARSILPFEDVRESFGLELLSSLRLIHGDKQRTAHIITIPLFSADDEEACERSVVGVRSQARPWWVAKFKSRELQFIRPAAARALPREQLA